MRARMQAPVDQWVRRGQQNKATQSLHVNLLAARLVTVRMKCEGILRKALCVSCVKLPNHDEGECKRLWK